MTPFTFLVADFAKVFLERNLDVNTKSEIPSGMRRTISFVRIQTFLDTVTKSRRFLFA
jgi:hypothetical protein